MRKNKIIIIAVLILIVIIVKLIPPSDCDCYKELGGFGTKTLFGYELTHTDLGEQCVKKWHRKMNISQPLEQMSNGDVFNRSVEYYNSNCDNKADIIYRHLND